MSNDFDATNKNQHKDKKIPKFHTIVHQFAKIGLKLSRRDNSVFYKLLGFLLRNDEPFPYTNEKLALNSLYKITMIKESLINLENLGLIVRTGFSYKRRFSKGKTLVNICAHSRYCIELHQKESCTQGRFPASTSRFPASTSRFPATTELNKNLRKLKEGVIKTLKPQNQKWPELTEEEKDLKGKYLHGLKYPQLQLKGIELMKGKALANRSYD